MKEHTWLCVVGSDRLRSRPLSKSPVDQLLGAIAMLDPEAAVALMAPHRVEIVGSSRRR